MYKIILRIKLTLEIILGMRKLLLTVAIGAIFTFIVYLGLVNSLTRPSINFIAMTNDTAISLVFKKNNISDYDINDVQTRYVYLKSDGDIYMSNRDTNEIGHYLGHNTNQPITGGNHFAWEIKLTNNKTYFIDGISGDIVSEQ